MVADKKVYFCRPASEFTIEELENELELVGDFEIKLFEISKGCIKRIGAQAFLDIARWIYAEDRERPDPPYFYESLFEDDATCLIDQFDGITEDQAWDAIVNGERDNRISECLASSAASLTTKICNALCRLKFIRSDIEKDCFLEDLFEDFFFTHLGGAAACDALGFIIENGAYETYIPKDKNWICEKIKELILM